MVASSQRTSGGRFDGEDPQAEVWWYESSEPLQPTGWYWNAGLDWGAGPYQTPEEAIDGAHKEGFGKCMIHQELICLAENLQLPLDTVTQTFGFVGRKGSGKTYAAMKLAEELHRFGAPFIVLDPVGNWWGLRVGADGESAGLSIPVFGGEQGDLPIGPHMGALVASIVMERGISAVLDVSTFRKNERKTFVTEFAEELFHRAKTARTPRMVIFEEAQLFAPQLAAKGEERMLGAIEDIVRLGRNYGLGSALLSQRPQSVNKEVLNQAECLLVGQLNAHHEREAIKNWIVHKGRDFDYLDQLPGLPCGTMFLWSPQWLGRFERIEISKRRTYDASATPKFGERVPVRELSPVDIDALSEAFRAALSPSKEGNKKPSVASTGLLESDRQFLLKFSSDLDSTVKNWRALVHTLQDLFAKIDLVQAPITKLLGAGGPHTSEVPKLKVKTEKPIKAPVGQQKDNPPFLTRAEYRMLVALVQHDPRALSMAQVAIFSGYSPRTSSVRNGLAALRSKHLIQGGNASMQATTAGKKAIGRFTPLPVGPLLLEAWLGKLCKAERLMLGVIVNAYPTPTNLAHVAGLAGYSEQTSSVRNGLGRLRSLGLVHGSNSAMVADSNLIEAQVRKNET